MDRLTMSTPLCLFLSCSPYVILCHTLYPPYAAGSSEPAIAGTVPAREDRAMNITIVTANVPSAQAIFSPLSPYSTMGFCSPLYTLKLRSSIASQLALMPNSALIRFGISRMNISAPSHATIDFCTSWSPFCHLL